MSRATKVAVAASLALCVASCACGRAESVEAREHERFEFEGAVGTNVLYGTSACVMTDTETGRQWVVVRVGGGGAAIAPLEVDE